MSAFRRLLPSRVLLRGAGLSSLLWSLVAALLGAAAALVLAALVDVVAAGGTIALRGEQLQAVAPAPESPYRRGTPEELNPDAVYLQQNQGLLATALRYHDRVFFPVLDGIVRPSPLLWDNTSAATILILLLAGLLLIRILARVRVEAAANRIAGQVAAQLRQSIHRQALRLSTGDLQGNAAQSSLDLFSREVDRIANAITVWVSRAPADTMLFILLLALAFVADARLTLQCIVPVAVAGWMNLYERHRSQQQRALTDSRAESELRTLAEGLRKSRLVRGYSMEQFESERFQAHLDRYAREMSRGRAREGWTIWTARGCTVLCVALVIFFISARVLSTIDPMPLSAGVLLLIALARGGRTVESARSLMAARQDINVAGDKVYRYLAEIPEVGQAVGAKFLEPVSKSIIFESVTYRAEGAEILKNLDLRIPARTSTAIVSLDPIERRAIAFLLPRFIEPQAGRVLFDSEDTAWATLESLRAETIYVGGSDPFFTGTVLENLTCGDSRYSTPEATDAAKVTHAHNFIQKLPQGYETVIGEHGERLDAGQAFRLGLARAMLRKPAVLVIEEPASMLDDDTKALLDDAYNRIVKDRTVIFLPTRLSTVRRCDQVVLLHEGRVVAAGSHETLVKQSELYRHWEYVTFKGSPRNERAAVRA
jgi:ABC-type multidrug transport system fused ATPase/permease subunit